MGERGMNERITNDTWNNERMDERVWYTDLNLMVSWYTCIRMSELVFL